MSAFPDWKKFAVPQRRPATGCIPTGYELILRAAGAAGIEFATFQDEFDFDKDRQLLSFRHPIRSLRALLRPRNNFETIAAAVEQKYPGVKFRVERFEKGKGNEKLAFIERYVTQRRPLLISLALEPAGSGWHIMPVVDLDDENLTLLNMMLPDGECCMQTVSRADLVRIHDELPGGDDVAYLEAC